MTTHHLTSEVLARHDSLVATTAGFWTKLRLNRRRDPPRSSAALIVRSASRDEGFEVRLRRTFGRVAGEDVCRGASPRSTQHDRTYCATGSA